jgi:hypothetical protein
MPENRDDFFNERDDPDELDDLDDAELPDGELDGRGWPPGASGYAPWPGPRRSGGLRRGLLVAAVATVAAGAGFGLVAIALRDVPGVSPAASSTPAAGNSGGSSGGSQLPPPGGLSSLAPGTSIMRLRLAGTVTAVSANSITIGGDGPSVTAAVTGATKVTGQVTSIGGVRDGDMVSALITGTDGHLVAESIQDPVSVP